MKNTFQGYPMDSSIEWQRAAYLFSLSEQGIIGALELDKSCLKYTLATGIKLPNHSLRPRAAKLADVTYTPDFRYTYNGVTVVEDVKAVYGNTRKNRAKGIAGKPIVTPASRIRIRLFQIRYPEIVFRVVTVATLDPHEVAKYFYF